MKKTVLSLVNYIGCIGMALFVTFVVEGTIGMILTYALVTALVVSLIMTLAVKRSVSVQPVLKSVAVSKGEESELTVKITNSSILPTPVISVKTECTAHFRGERETTLSGAVSARGVNTLSFPFTAVHSGKAHIKIKEILLTDYLGIFSFRLTLPDETALLGVAVFPDIPDVSVQTSLVKTSSRFMSNEDDEEESEDISPVPTGLAGYNHREYIPGDPLKRINWKMSSKRDILMVRLDESIKGSGRIILFDCPKTDENESTLTVRDNVTEGALAHLGSLLKEGREANFIFYKQGLWITAELKTPSDIFALQEELSDLEPCDNPTPYPSELEGVSSAPICFTCATADCLSSAEFIVSRNPDTMLISSFAASLPVISANQWFLSDGFELNKI